MIKNKSNCALNSAGVYLGTFDVVFETLSAENSVTLSGELFEKLPGYDGTSMVADDEFLVHRVTNLSQDQHQSSFLNVYSRLQIGSNSAAQY